MKADNEMKLLYADCLSELGAIDPGKMVTVASTSPLGRGASPKNLDEISSPTFIMDYIEVLVTSLLSAQTAQIQVSIRAVNHVMHVAVLMY